MKRACKQIWEGLVDLAEGRESPEAKAHLATCSDCTLELDRLQRLVGAARHPTYQAPTDVKEMAARIMPRRQRRTAVLAHRTLAATAARSGGADAQMTFEVDGHSIRVMVTEEPSGWLVLGQGPSGDWQISSTGADAQRDEGGRFEIERADLNEPILLRGPEYDIEIPPLAELLNDRG
jgi:hypothetical protein